MAGETLAVSIGAMCILLFLVLAVMRTIFALKTNKKLDQLNYSLVGNKTVELENAIGKVPEPGLVNPQLDMKAERARKMREGKERAKKLRDLEAKKKQLAEEEAALNA